MTPDAAPPPPPPSRDPAHSHGPRPSFEWILDGDREVVLPHLRAIGPALTLGEDHFHVAPVSPVDPVLPDLFEVRLGDEPVGALDFLPLPADRTLMRLYLCSDLGTACRIDGGDAVMQGFGSAWLQRLAQLGFMSQSARPGEAPAVGRPLGFRRPPAAGEAADPTPDAARHP